MAYDLRDGRVWTFSLETHAVDHCNLRCAQCCPLSPHQAPGQVEPAQLADDLARARTVLAPRTFKFTGGEPLLHPELPRLVEIAQESGIAERVQVTTNGLLLARAPEALFAAVDRIQLSWYPSAPLSEKALADIEARCAAHEVELEVRAYERFQRITPEAPLDDAGTRAAHAGCWMKVRCHTLLRGRLYACTRPPKLGPYLRARGVPNDLESEDGLDLASPDLLRRVLRLLEQEEPYASCRHCLGGQGDWQPHRQLGREETTG